MYVLMLNGIDCPEKGQAFGQRAKQAASERASVDWHRLFHTDNSSRAAMKTNQEVPYEMV